MAKESMKAREVKRAKTVAKYAEKRKALKEAGDYDALQKLPKNASPIRMHNRCKLTCGILVKECRKKNTDSKLRIWFLFIV